MDMFKGRQVAFAKLKHTVCCTFFVKPFYVTLPDWTVFKEIEIVFLVIG